MTYNKPELIALETPIKAIQGGFHKGAPWVLERVTDPRDPYYDTLTSTASAYEADE
jgi:hypothetical protein